jgi:diguanylate cyclase (GGDEF)-like protein
MAPRLGLFIITGCLLVIATLSGGAWLLMERSRQTAMNTGAGELQHAALVVENTINREFLQVDGALASLPNLLATVAESDGLVDPNEATHLLRGVNFQTFIFRDLMLVKPDGTLWAAARPALQNRPLPIPLRDLDGSGHPGAIVIAGPVRNPMTGDWTLYLARSITLPGEGSLEAIAEVPLPMIADLLAPIGEVPGLKISLERRNGQLLASLPHDELRIGKTAELPVAGLQTNGIAFLVPLSILPGPRLAVARPILYDGLYAIVTLDVQKAMAGWWRDRSRLALVVALASLLVVALGTALYTVLRQRERVEMERRKAREMLDSAIDSMSDGFVMWDQEDRLVICNQKYRDIYKISAPFLKIGARFVDIIRAGVHAGQYPQAGEDVAGFVRHMVAWHRTDQEPLERELPDGRWVLITERRTPNGGTVGIRTDITAFKQASADLVAANARVQQAMAELERQNFALRERDQALHTQNVLFNAALNNMSHGLLMTDTNYRVIVCNNRFLDLFKLRVDDVTPGMTATQLFHAIQHGGQIDMETAKAIFMEQLVLGASRRVGTFIAGDDDGRALAVSQRPLADGGWVATYEDVTEQQRAERRIRFMAHHDALTKLPNRALFRSRLDDALRDLSEKGPGLALLYLDLDKFKNVNDTLGHPVGDALLEAAAQRLQSCLRATDIVARLGGDEFAIVHTADDLPDAAKFLAQRVISSLSAPYQMAGRNAVVGVSVGIAIATDVGISTDTLLKNADMALYQAKTSGRGTCCVFDAEMDAKLHARLAIEEEMRIALDQQQFEIMYQPLYDCRTERTSGFEALLRWNHPVRGVVLPDQFIPLAEELGLIQTIGAWVLQKVCADSQYLPQDLKFAVNLSPMQLKSDDIVTKVTSALAVAGMEAGRLELEITETTLLTNNEATVALLFRLRELGLKISLDDFGTGYSSLSYLRTFPFDKIKIDRSFVREMDRRNDCVAIVGSIIELANKLGIATTAEGVETVAQLQQLRDFGCSEAQGYLLGVPRSLAEVQEYFAGHALVSTTDLCP